MTDHVELLTARFSTALAGICALDTMRVSLFGQLYHAPASIRSAWHPLRTSRTLLRDYYQTLYRQRLAALSRTVSESDCIYAQRIGMLLSDQEYVALGDADRTMLRCVVNPDGSATLSISTPWTLVALWDVRTLRYRTLITILETFGAAGYTLDTSLSVSSFATPV